MTGLGLVLLFTQKALAADTLAATVTVKDDYSLSEIAILLYANVGRWREIATANNLEAPYRIRPGQKLKLKNAPTLTKAQGRERLIAHYRARLRLSTPNVVAEEVVSSQQPATPLAITEQALSAAALSFKNSRTETPEHKETSRALNTQKQLALGKAWEAEKLLPAPGDEPASFIVLMRAELESGKTIEARKLAEQFAERFPEMRELPLVKKALANVEGASP